MNAARLGNVGYNVNSTDTVIDDLNSADTGTVQPEVTRINHPSNTESSIMQYTYLIEHQDMVHNTYDDAMRSPCADNWQEAVDSEVVSLIKNGTWRVVKRPMNRKVQTCAFIFRKKYTGINSQVKYKARLVAHGYRQLYGTDYWETYAPVSSSRAIRVLLSIAASKRMIIHQMDVDTAFLNAPLEETIYMLPPKGLTGIPEGHVLELKKSLYGLKQSPRNFNKDLNTTLLDLGFARCTSDTCIYTKTVNNLEEIKKVEADVETKKQQISVKSALAEDDEQPGTYEAATDSKAAAGIAGFAAAEVGGYNGAPTVFGAKKTPKAAKAVKQHLSEDEEHLGTFEEATDSRMAAATAGFAAAEVAGEGGKACEGENCGPSVFGAKKTPKYPRRCLPLRRV